VIHATTVGSFSVGEWDDFEKEAKADSGYNPGGCGMGALLDALGPDARAAVEGAMERDDIMSTAILRGLKERGIETAVSDFTLRRHRQDKCSCSRRSS
jgi:hypothetical protein